MSILIDHQSINVPAGTRDFGPVTVPNGLTRLTLRLARRTTVAPTLWAAGVRVQLDSWVSLDGGTSWSQSLGFGAEGGIYVKRDGSEATESTATATIPAGSNRRIKASAVISGGTLVSQLTLEVV